MNEWAKAELGSAKLGDSRRMARVVRTTELLAESPGESVPDACGSWADTEGAYRLWSNGRVSAQAILEAHFQSTAARARLEKRVLVIQDGSSLDLTTHKATKDLGYLESKKRRGLFFHPSLVATEAGVPLGLADAQIWSRPLAEFGKAKDRHAKPIIEKESYVWLLAWANAQKRLPSTVQLVGIADQEADIYELFAAPRRPGAELLVRATGDRRVKDPARLLGDAVRGQPKAGTLSIEVPRRPELPQRCATLSVRFAPMTLLASYQALRHQGSLLPPEVPTWAVLLEEEHPPKGAERLSWLLLTTLPVESYEGALEVAGLYKRRWLVEQYFYVLKQGCLVEKLQLETASAMERAIACFAVVAWRIQYITLDARYDPHGPCDALLAEHEWTALFASFYPGRKIPADPLTKREAVRLIARLGGFLARKGDGDPGVKTIWKGLAHLRDLSNGYRLALRGR